MKNLLMLLMFISTQAFAGKSNIVQPHKFSKDSTVVIDQPITQETLEPVYKFLEEGLSHRNLPSEINIIIDSPGGEVRSGFKLISMMNAAKAKGTKFSCYVTNLAASMAFHILTQCDSRYALENSTLLWHRARVFVMGEVITSPMAKILQDDLSGLDDIIFKAIKQSMSADMSDTELKYHFESETAHIAKNLKAKLPKFMTVSSSFDGLLEASSDKTYTRTASLKRNPLDIKNSPAPVKPKNKNFTYVYIPDEYLETLKQMLQSSSSPESTMEKVFENADQ